MSDSESDAASPQACLGRAEGCTRGAPCMRGVVARRVYYIGSGGTTYYEHSGAAVERSTFQGDPAGEGITDGAAGAAARGAGGSATGAAVGASVEGVVVDGAAGTARKQLDARVIIGREQGSVELLDPNNEDAPACRITATDAESSAAAAASGASGRRCQPAHSLG